MLQQILSQIPGVDQASVDAVGDTDAKIAAMRACVHEPYCNSFRGCFLRYRACFQVVGQGDRHARLGRAARQRVR